MEEQKITTITKPRITLKKLSTGIYNWDISSSEGETLTEIIEEIEKANNLMKSKFKKEGVQKKE